MYLNKYLNKIIFVIIIITTTLFVGTAYAKESILIEKASTCFGSTKKGRLNNGVSLPPNGPNFTSYGFLPELMGRTYVHSKVKAVVINSYKQLETLSAKSLYKYAETGFEEGGRFKPHKTHQNGLSIDFMVPVINNQNKKATYFTTNALNRYGYDVNFGDDGRSGQYQIDFDAMAAHLMVLNKAALKKGITIWRVLFAPDLQPKLYSSKYGAYLKKNIFIPTKRSWVRHDEHYHVDFKLKCKPL